MKRGACVIPCLMVLGFFIGCSDAVAGNVELLGHGGGFCSGVAASGQYAYVTDFSGFSVLDISTPGAPVLRGHLLLPDSADHAGGMVVSGNRVYLPWSSGVFSAKSAKATTTGGFRVVDVSNPANPQLIASYAAPGGVTGLAVRDGIAYVPWVVVDVSSYVNYGGLQLLDISDPASPAILGECNTGASMGVVLNGNKAYVPRFGGMCIVDITSSAAPTVVGAYNSGAVISVSWDLALSGTTACFVQTKTTNLSTCSYTLEVLNVSDPAAPSLLGSCALSSFNGIIVDVMALALSGNRVFVANNEAGLQVVDVSNAASPQLVVSRLMPSEVSGIALSGSTAYLSSGLAGLSVVNMADPADPVLQRSCLVGGPGKTVVSGQHAYSCWENHFHKGSIWRHSGGVRITTVPCMAETAAIDTPGKAWSVAVTGDRAYILWNDDEANATGIEIYNVQNPAVPVRLGTYTPPHAGGSIAASGNTVFVADSNGNLDIANLSDIANPLLLVDAYAGSSPFDHLRMEGNALYSFSYFSRSGFDYGGITVLDVSNPQSPVVLQSFLQGWWELRDMKRQGNTSFLVDGGIFEIVNRTLSQTYSFNPMMVQRAAVSGRLAYLGGPTGLTVLDIINPAKPLVVGSYGYAGLNDMNLCSKDGTAYLSDNDGGLFALRYSGPLSSDLSSQFDTEWATLCDLVALSPDSADLNGDGLPERWALRLIQAVLDSATAPFHEAACTAYIDNFMELSGEPDPVVQQNRECIAALLMMGADIRDYATTRFGLTGVYHVVEGEPFSGTADIDHDRMTNAQECAAVVAWGGTIDTFPEMALHTSGAGPVPVAGVAGLGVLLGLMAIIGARKMRRSSREALFPR